MQLLLRFTFKIVLNKTDSLFDFYKQGAKVYYDTETRQL